MGVHVFRTFRVGTACIRVPLPTLRASAIPAAQERDMSDMRLIVAGAGGRMGRTLVKAIAETPGLALVGATEGEGSPHVGQDSGVLAGLPPNRVVVTSEVRPLTMAADAIIDFTVPAATVKLAALAAETHLAHIIG